MPRCNECGNDTKFVTAWIEFEVSIFEGDKCVDNIAGDRDRYDNEYPPECIECGSSDIEGVEMI